MRRFLVGLLATIGFLTLLVGIIGAAAVAWFMRQAGPTLPEQILLVADLREELPEALPTRGIASLGLDGEKLTVSDVTLALEQAAGDPRVRGLIAHVDDTSHGFAVAQELRQAVERFRAGGKFAVAHADTFGELTPGNEGYYLAAAFDRIELQPAGLLGLTGIAAELPFVGKLLNDLGIRLEVEKRAEYKTVLENFSEAQISPANREMLEGIVGELAEPAGRRDRRRPPAAARGRRPAHGGRALHGRGGTRGPADRRGPPLRRGAVGGEGQGGAGSAHGVARGLLGGPARRVARRRPAWPSCAARA